MRPVRPFGLATALLAPLVLIGGWTYAASLTAGFDSTRDTISALAARGAPHREVMTTCFVLLGLCHLGTAAALRPAPRAGRAVLAVGGVATVGVAVFPLPTGGHSRAATLAFVCLCLWPLLSVRRSAWVLHPRVVAPAFTVLLALLLWFVAVLDQPEHLEGLAERAAAGSQALWPLVTVVALTMQLRRQPAGPARP